MRITNRITLLYLLGNKVRTWATIVGIALVMTMITSVSVGMDSVLSYLRRITIAYSGAYSGVYCDVPPEDVNGLLSNGVITGHTVFETVTSIVYDNDTIDVVNYSPDYSDYVAIDLNAGRMPENSDEITITRYYCYVYDKDIGDKIYFGGREYTITGVADVNAFSGSDYFFTVDADAQGPVTIFFTLDKPEKFYDYLDKGVLKDSYGLQCHDDLIAYEGTRSVNRDTLPMIILEAVPVILIAMAAVSLIGNSFSISIKERIRQIAMIKSEGATGRQINGSIVFEALVLCAMAIPAGAVFGILLVEILILIFGDSVVSISGFELRPELVVNPWAVVFCALFCVGITLLAATFSIRVVSRTSIVEVIRQNDIVKLRRRRLKFAGIFGKIFGYEGVLAAKSYERNRVRYRTIVASLIISIVLFVSAGAFCHYLNSEYNRTAEQYKKYPDIAFTYDCNSSYHQPDWGLFLKIQSIKSITASVFTANATVKPVISPELYSDEYKLMQTEDNAVYCDVVFVQDDIFNHICEDNSISASGYYNAAAPRGLLYDMVQVYATADGGKSYTATDVELFKKYMSDSLIRINGGTLRIGQKIDKLSYGIDNSTQDFLVIYPMSLRDSVASGLGGSIEWFAYNIYIKSDSHSETSSEIKRILKEANDENGSVYDYAEDIQAAHTANIIIKTFAYGFTVMISLIAMVDIFNTISTSVQVRRREFAVLSSVGMSKRSIRKMVNVECLLCGIRSVVPGAVLALLSSVAIYIFMRNFDNENVFYLPIAEICIVLTCVLTVIFASMLYAMSKLKDDNPTEVLDCDNI